MARPRGVGMLCGFDSPVDGLELARRCLENGLMLGVFREGPGPVRVTPPLNVTCDELDEGFGIMDRAYRSML